MEILSPSLVSGVQICELSQEGTRILGERMQPELVHDQLENLGQNFKLRPDIQAQNIRRVEEVKTQMIRKFFLSSFYVFKTYENVGPYSR